MVLFLGTDTIRGEFESSIHVYLEDFEYPFVINVFGNIKQSPLPLLKVPYFYDSDLMKDKKGYSNQNNLISTK